MQLRYLSIYFKPYNLIIMTFCTTNALNDLRTYSIDVVASKYNMTKEQLISKLSKF